jgi:hypothetical protein
MISNNDLTLEQLKLRAYGIVKEWLEEIYRGVEKA